jgi:2-methylcitrate dehydratase PrpD
MTTRALAAFTSALQFADLPPATVQKAKCLLLDGIGCLLAGIAAGPGKSAAEFVRHLESTSQQATLYAGKTRGTVRDAAFVNAMTLYSIGLNDIHKPSVSHPGACVIPLLLAIGEWRRISGSELIAALVAGYEVMGRVGRSVTPTHRERGFHPTGTYGTFGAAAAAARLFGFNAEETANTLGIAGSQAAGLFEFHRDGTLTMIFHAARAAQNGVEAALLSSAGLTGPTTVLEGSRGFCRATSNAFDVAALTRNLGQDYEVDATSFRPYYGCSSTIPGSGATAQIIRNLGGCLPEEVEKVLVRCNPVVANDNADRNPTTLLGARLSMPFNLSLVLAQGDVHTADVTERELDDARIRNNLDKVHLEADAAMPRFGASVTITLRDGRRGEAAVLQPLGDPGTPLDWQDVVDKFGRLTRSVIRPDSVSAIADVVRNIEHADGGVLAKVLRESVGV